MKMMLKVLALPVLFVVNVIADVLCPKSDD